MTRSELPARPRIIGSQAVSYVGQNVTVVGEALSVVPHADTLTIKMPESDNMIVLLQKNSTTIDLNLLTEVSGKLVSRAQIEASSIKQYNAKETAKFNRSLYIEAAKVYAAHRSHYDI